MNRTASTFAALVALLLTAGAAGAQTVTWEKTYGTNAFFTAIERTPDGGYILVGQTGNAPGRLLALKTDANGVEQWQKSYGGVTPTDVAFANGVTTTADGGFLVAGGRLGAPYLMKLTASGDSVWARTYGVDAGNGTGSSLATVATSDGGYLAVGNLFRSGFNASRIHLYKVDASGVQQWEKFYGNPDDANLGAMIRRTSDGSFAIAGYHGMEPGADIYLAKVDASGDKVWDAAYEGIRSTRDRDDARDLRQTSDGGFVLAGRRAVTATSYDTDLMVMKTDATGAKLWEKSFGGAGYDLAHALQLTGDGGMIVVGAETATLTYADRRVWVLKLDAGGNKIWETTLVNGAGRGVVVNTDGSIVIAGSSGSQAYLAKLGGAAVPPDRKVYRYPSTANVLYELRSPVEWQGAGPGRISVSNQTITINGLVKFTGTMTIDTTQAAAGGTAAFTSTGRYWLADAPLPMGARGELTLFEGSITNGGLVGRGFVFDGLDPDAKGLTLAGLRLRTVELGTIGGTTATAAKLSATATVIGATRCDAQESSEFLFRDIVIGGETLEIGTTEPIQLSPMFCLEGVVGTYARSTDILRINGLVRPSAIFPGRLQAMTGITGGVMLPAILALPDGVSTIAIGTAAVPPSISDLGAVLAFGFLSVNGTVLSPDGFYNSYLFGGTLNSASSIEGETWDANMAGLASDFYHIMGEPRLTLTWVPDGGIWVISRFAGAMRAGKLESGRFAIDGTGELTVANLGANTAVTGTITGTFTRPKYHLGDWQPMEIFVFKLPAGGTIANHEAMIRKASNKSAKIHTKVPSAIGFSMKDVVIDLSAKEDDPSFFGSVYNVREIIGLARTVDPDGVAGAAADRTHPLEVRPQTEEILIRAWSQGTLAGTYLSTPEGERIDATKPDSSVVHVVDGRGQHFWALRAPTAGTWTVGITDGVATDSIEVLVSLAHRPLDITATQQGRTVTARWNAAGAPAGSRIELHLDTDARGYDGIPIGTVDEAAGELSYTLADSLPECRYHLFAIRDENDRLDYGYASLAIDNAKARLAAPGAITVSYQQATRAAVLTWTRSSDPSAVGYMVRLTNARGEDSLYAMPFAHQTTTSFTVDTASGATIAMATYDSLGRTGCWSAEVSLLPTSGIERDAVTGGRLSLTLGVAPNPMRGEADVRITLAAHASVEVIVVDLSGREVLRHDAGTLEAGERTLHLETAGLASGTYMVIVRAGALAGAERITVER